MKLEQPRLPSSRGEFFVTPGRAFKASLMPANYLEPMKQHAAVGNKETLSGFLGTDDSLFADSARHRVPGGLAGHAGVVPVGFHGLARRAFRRREHLKRAGAPSRTHIPKCLLDGALILRVQRARTCASTVRSMRSSASVRIDLDVAKFNRRKPCESGPNGGPSFRPTLASSSMTAWARDANG